MVTTYRGTHPSKMQLYSMVLVLRCTELCIFVRWSRCWAVCLHLLAPEHLLRGDGRTDAYVVGA